MKSSRRQKIIELIKENDIATQEELALLLNKEGFNVTQATVSRDIRKLNLAKKQDGKGKLKYYVEEPAAGELNDKYVRVFSECYVSMDMAMNILVIKTVPGMAMAVAAALDGMHFNEIVGTIAGDDTIMCAIKSVDDTYRLMDKLKKILQ